MAKKIEDPMKGLYRQKLGWWFRYWHGGKQCYHNCQTRDPAEAIIEKNRFLEEEFGKVASAKSWSQYVSEYLAEKKSRGEMKNSTEIRVKSVLKMFQECCPEVKRPEDVNYEKLEKFWKKSRKTSDSTGKTYLTTLQGFLSELGVLRKRFKIPRTAKIGARETWVEMDVINKWRDACTDKKLKYVLFCLGNLGMRAGEVKFSAVEWFKDGICTIPAKMTYKLKNGKTMTWSPKDGESRQIPINPEFQEFLNNFLHGKKGLVLTSLKSKDGTWDFRLPLAKYMAEVGYPDFFPHAFRHSWITYLMKKGYPIQKVAIWSGDNLATLEKHYWKKQTAAGELDVSGKAAKSINDEVKEAVMEGVNEVLEKLGIKAAKQKRPISIVEAWEEITDKKTLKQIQRKMKEVVKDSNYGKFFEGMSEQQIADFYKENGLDPNEPIFVAYGEIEEED